MFRQRDYSNEKDNSLFTRLCTLENNEINYTNIKFWDINLKTWVDCDNLTNYKIQKEVQTDDELIFYIYSEDYDAKE